MNRKYTIIEIKTTGYNAILDRICYISLTEFDSDFKAKRSFTTWLNPNVKMTPTWANFLGVTNEELKSYPEFSEVVDTVQTFLKDRTLGTFDNKVDTIEFLREALYDEDVSFKYPKKDFIIIKNLEDYIYKRDLETLYYKYTGTKLPVTSIPTKQAGEILKYQCETLGEDANTFEYSKVVKNDLIEFTDKYLYEVDGETYFNFGKHKDEKVQEVKKSYLEWIVASDFPKSVKEIIEDNLNK